ncbi:MAG: EutN/CcmL family microcompartment protein [Bacillota bacterium]|jgi:ethanolamine utilization protein EutN|uniref:EutN/CcmL family microcompartment protein n=1 Tax=Bacillus sp. RO2 TaxID=2723913 RepID=UPI00145DF40A|nr:EutN/CcmL family microcompartment protein [Bacillus sp. RO2]MEA3321402.1 EutN/CcmL family microcompartment protein [Bacillota bacterium]NMH72103.1 EutN/CcmL family microcompartment protein [Bacillus sp. RO2]
MIIAKVTGSIVATTKAEKLKGKKLLIVTPLDMKSIEEDGKPIVAIDTVGSGVGEVVLIVSGSSARQTEITNGVPVDAAIVGIVDQIELNGSLTFSKGGN